MAPFRLSFYSLHRMIFQPRNQNSKRITIVLHPQLFTRLQTRSDYEGRSLSNLCAYLLERAMSDD
jgi:hypothetical protein